MSRITRVAIAAALSATLVLAAAATAFASSITLNGTPDGYELAIETTGEYTASDLFSEFKNVIPGDERTQEIAIRNDSYLPVHVYLRAEAHGVENGLTYDEAYEKTDGKDQADVDGERDETVDSANAFLSLLNLTVKNGEKVIFDASPDQEAGLAENVYLGTLFKGQSIALDLTLSVPLEVDGAALGNAFANRVGEVDWVFTVSEVIYPDPPEDPEDPGNPDDPDTPLPDTGDVPEDPSIPEGPLGQTGDSAPLALLAGISVIAALVVVVAVIMKRATRRF